MQPWVYQNTGFDLNASASWDADRLDDDLYFQWRCEQAGSGESCGEKISNLISNKSVLHVPPNSLELDVIYNFSVQVTSMARLGYDCYPERENTAVVLLQAKKVLPAEAQIDVCSTPKCETPLNPSRGVYLVSPDKIRAQPIFLRLSSSCTAKQNVAWDTTLPKSQESKISPRQLLKPHPLLVPSETLKYVPVAGIVDAQYTFTVGIHCDAEGVLPFSKRSVEVRVNAPPFGGRLLAEPTRGEALTTTFRISHSIEWTDDQFPLSYSYSITTSPTREGSIKNEETIENQFFLTELPIPASSLKTYLPISGNCQNNYTVTIIVEVTDHLGSSARCGTAENDPCATARVRPYSGDIATFTAGLSKQTDAVKAGTVSSTDLSKLVLAAIQTSSAPKCLDCGPYGKLSADKRACICDSDHTGLECKKKETFHWDEWSPWSECDSGCGSGKRTRTRDCIAKHRQTTVPSSKCQGDASDFDTCVVLCSSEWSVWGDCSASCKKDAPGVVWGERGRQRTCLAASKSDCEHTEDSQSCSVTCKASCPGDCSGHGKCVLKPQDCIDPSACSRVCVCDQAFSGPTCDVSKDKQESEQKQNSVFVDAIWASLQEGMVSCPVLRNALSMIMDIIHGDLGALATDDLLELLKRISSTFLSSTQCVLDRDLNALLGLVPAYINAERLRNNKQKQKNEARPGTRRLQKSVDTENDKLTQMGEFLRDSLDQLTLNKLKVSVPGEKPTEISSGDVLRLMSTNNVALPASMCTQDETSCASYPPNSLRCPGTESQFGIAMVGQSAYLNWPTFS